MFLAPKEMLKNLYSALKDCVQPDPMTWDVCTITRIIGRANGFDAAGEKVASAVEKLNGQTDKLSLSGLDSDSIKGVQSKSVTRKRLPIAGSTPYSRKRIVVPRSSESSSSDTESDTDVTNLQANLPPTPSPLQISNKVNTSNTSEVGGAGCSKWPDAGIPQPVSKGDADFQRLVLRKLAQLQKQHENLHKQHENTNALLRQLMGSNGIGPESVVDKPANINLPVSSIDELHNLEDYVANKENYKHMLGYLSTLGGDTVRTNTARIMTTLIEDKVATELNWQGRGGKTGMKDKKVSKLVASVVALNKKTSGATEADVEKEIKYWCQHAEDRMGGRERRRANPDPHAEDRVGGRQRRANPDPHPQN